jgi:hypothetical protein
MNGAAKITFESVMIYRGPILGLSKHFIVQLLAPETLLAGITVGGAGLEPGAHVFCGGQSQTHTWPGFFGGAISL